MRKMRLAKSIRRDERAELQRLRSLPKCPPSLPLRRGTCPRCGRGYPDHELGVCIRNCCLCHGTREGHFTKRLAYAIVNGKLCVSGRGR
jgi:hypothetical protein